MIKLKYTRGSDGVVRARILCSLEEAGELFLHAYTGAREDANHSHDPTPHKLQADKYAELMASVRIKAREHDEAH